MKYKILAIDDDEKNLTINSECIKSEQLSRGNS